MRGRVRAVAEIKPGPKTRGAPGEFNVWCTKTKVRDQLFYAPWPLGAGLISSPRDAPVYHAGGEGGGGAVARGREKEARSPRPRCNYGQTSRLPCRESRDY